MYQTRPDDYAAFRCLAGACPQTCCAAWEIVVDPDAQDAYLRLQHPLAAKLRLKHTATNGDRNLGREAIVLSPVTAEVPGRVRLDGVDWNARCATPGDTLTPGSLCRVTEIHSTLLIVEPVLTESRNPHTTT